MADLPPRVTQEQWDALDAAGEQAIAARLSRIQRMKRLSIEGSTMTNETTASQPKSIGDDAQFRELLENVQHENHCRMDGEDVALIVFIDSKIRAPAAQASATIQAAPDDPLDWPIPCDLVDDAVTLRKGVKLRTVLARLKFLSRLCRANLPKAYQYDVEHPNDGLNETTVAATIQAPVMVAEPGLRHSVAARKHAERIDNMHKGVVGVFAAIKAEHLAAPMVAAPVAWRRATKHGWEYRSSPPTERMKGAGWSALVLPSAAPMVAEPVGADVCKSCEGSGEVTGFIGSGPDGWEETPNCPDCGGTGEPAAPMVADPASVDTVLLRVAVDSIESDISSYMRTGDDATLRMALEMAVFTLRGTATVKAVPSEALTGAARDILAERQRQVDVEGWTPEHDDMHGDGQMAVAAGFYALQCGYPHERTIWRGDAPMYWPWAASWWKPTTKRANLVKAGALILAEIERIDRAAPLADKTGGGE